LDGFRIMARRIAADIAKPPELLPTLGFRA